MSLGKCILSGLLTLLIAGIDLRLVRVASVAFPRIGLRLHSGGDL